MTTLYCPECGYNLTALPENRCPECGKAFDPGHLQDLQRTGLSTRSLVLQLILFPAGFTLLVTLCLFGVVATQSPFGVLAAGPLMLGAIMLHTVPLSRSFARAHQLRVGRDNAVWLFRKAWPCCVLFTLIEAALTFTYFAGGCALIIMNLNFH